MIYNNDLTIYFFYLPSPALTSELLFCLYLLNLYICTAFLPPLYITAEYVSIHSTHPEYILELFNFSLIQFHTCPS